MKRLGVCGLTLGLLLAGGVLSGASCDGLLNPLGADIVTVNVVNNGDFPIVVEIYYAGEQLIPESLLTSAGTRVDLTIQPGQTETFTRDCDDLQAIIVNNADLQVFGGAGPETRGDVLRDGTDFNCRDSVMFTFDHGLLLVDFAETATVRSP